MYTLDISIKPRKGRRMSGVYLASCLEGRKSRDIPEGARPVSANKRAIMFFLVSSQPVILMIESTSKRGTLPPFFSSCEAIWQRRTKQRDGHTQLNNVSSLGGERLINLCVYMSLFSVCVCVRPETELWWAVGEKGLTQYLNTGRLSHRMEFSFHQLNRFLGLYYSGHTHTQVIWHLRQFAYWERERESSIHPLFSQMFVYSGRSPFFPLSFSSSSWILYVSSDRWSITIMELHKQSREGSGFFFFLCVCVSNAPKHFTGIVIWAAWVMTAPSVAINSNILAILMGLCNSSLPKGGMEDKFKSINPSFISWYDEQMPVLPRRGSRFWMESSKCRSLSSTTSRDR